MYYVYLCESSENIFWVRIKLLKGTYNEVSLYYNFTVNPWGRYILFFLLLFYYSCPNFPHCSPCPTHPLLPQSISTLLSTSMCNLYLFFSYALPLLSTTIPLPSGPCHSVPCFHASGSVLLVSLFCSLDSSYKWDHKAFVFHRLAYFT